MEVAIVGAGIGGLALALALHKAGIEAKIFERSRSVRALGVGINILPHAVAHLSEWGLLDGLDAVGVRTRELIYKTADGRDILRQPRGLDAGHAAPQFSIHRGHLQRVLYEAVRDRLGADAIRTGHTLVAHEEREGRVAATFETEAGRDTVEADVLVGADGIHSAIRGSRWPREGAPSWNGVLMWRGATFAPRYLDGRTMIIAGGMRAKLVLYPIHHDRDRPGEALTNWVICAKLGGPDDPLPVREDWSKAAELSDVMPHVDGVIDIPELDVKALIAATEAFYVYPMCDRDPLPWWSEGRVTLLGDAAHPMYPVGSNGASQAVLDAVSLAKHLRDDGVAGLSAYEEERRPATAAIVRANRIGGPERVIDLVEERAPNGFASLDEVASREELTAIVGEYQAMAGFASRRVCA